MNEQTLAGMWSNLPGFFRGLRTERASCVEPDTGILLHGPGMHTVPVQEQQR